jgi:hypothetical protein
VGAGEGGGAGFVVCSPDGAQRNPGYDLRTIWNVVDFGRRLNDILFNLSSMLVRRSLNPTDRGAMLNNL